MGVLKVGRGVGGPLERISSGEGSLRAGLRGTFQANTGVAGPITGLAELGIEVSFWEGVTGRES